MATRTIVKATTVVDQPVGYRMPVVPWNGLTVTDLFCGAGGSSSGLVEAGYRVIIAANHWERAIASHQLNHPDTDHSQADISQVDPRYFPRTDVLWASPECTNHSIAKGVKRQQALNEALFELDGTRPLDDAAANRSRATMWDVPRFAEVHRYRAIIIENVVDAYRWIMFPAWLQAMELLGYRHEIVWLNSMHAQEGGLPAPQSRDRMYVVFWRKSMKGRPPLERWTQPKALCMEHGEVRASRSFKKEERWGRYRAQYVYRCPKCGIQVEPGWLPAASIIDWSIPAQRIGDRKKPLAEKTRERIRKGIERHWAPLVVEAAGNAYDSTDPKHPQHGTEGGYVRAWPADDPLRTLHGTATKGVALPLVMTNNHENHAKTVGEPLPTATTATTQALIVRGEGNTVPARPASDPLGALTASGSMFVAQPMLVPYFSKGVARSTSEPMGTVTTVERDALLVPAGGTWRSDAVSARGPLPAVTTREADGLVVPLRNHGVAKPTSEPIDTVSAEGNHHALLMRNNHGGAEMTTPVDEPMRTLTTGGHQSLLEALPPISLDVDDAGFRMLEPHEIQRGMGFAADYVLLGTKREQVKQAGNAVTPPVARDVGHAVAAFLNEMELAA
ncbi:DNA cytosine methyltransferase [Microbacterium sp. H37-C3]|uniref:DNA cytosine methyltransferase n=1 Tax=Microbacterium sp. H37-C3 TaxID=3004354 RepID=UPI0022AF1393|nr:DNA cytosine methyltransferase [Microbacterium sp. H37-C3]MCZ4066489.1 DNA cytosine methyltransferase [Microbacterium sp. H37-C3]